jgi:hypothetical protein
MPTGSSKKVADPQPSAKVIRKAPEKPEKEEAILHQTAGAQVTRDLPSSSENTTFRSDSYVSYEKNIRKTFEGVWARKEKRNSLEVVYKVHWHLHSFISPFFPSTQQIGDIITLTGNHEDAWATTCRQYLSTNYPKSGTLLIDVLQQILDMSKLGA